MTVVKFRMLMWVCDVTRLDRIRNRCKKASLGVTDKNIKQNKLIWFGRDVKRRNNDEIVRRYVE